MFLSFAGFFRFVDGWRLKRTRFSLTRCSWLLPVNRVLQKLERPAWSARRNSVMNILCWRLQSNCWKSLLVIGFFLFDPFPGEWFSLFSDFQYVHQLHFCMRGLPMGQEEQWCFLFQVQVVLTVLGRLVTGEESRGQWLSVSSTRSRKADVKRLTVPFKGAESRLFPILGHSL